MTGARSEYGLLYHLLKALRDDAGVELQLIVAGSHLSREFGFTYREIEKDGLVIGSKIKFPLKTDTSLSSACAFSICVRRMAEELERLRPDVMVVYSDRYEMLAAASAAMLMQVPMAHIGGGEVTEGVIDDSVRHSITKMAHLHLVTAQPYADRVIQLGESPERVHVVGTPGLDHLARLNLMGREALEGEIGFRFREINFLVTYHPETAGPAGDQATACGELLAALDEFKDAGIIFTRSNPDAGNARIWKKILQYEKKHASRVKTYLSLGQLKYLSVMNQCVAVIGNSSSGIVEAPALKKASVNIGRRQDGRLMADSIIPCSCNKLAIKKAIEKALSRPFQSRLASVQSLYGMGKASEKIAALIKSSDWAALRTKKFFDLPRANPVLSEAAIS